MRALVVNPWVYDFKCHDFWIRPFGMLRLAAFLKDFNIAVDMIDCMDRFDPEADDKYKRSDEYGCGEYENFELAKPDIYMKVPRRYKRYGFSVEVFLKKINRLEKPDIIFITSAMTYMYEGVQLAIHYLKEKFPLTTIVLGGIYATICHSHAVARSGADLVWQGNINNDFIRIFNKFTGASIQAKPDEYFASLVPDYSFYKELPHASVKFTEGCPFTCSYCAVKIFHQGFLQRGTASIIAELDLYKSRGTKQIAFYDDALLYKNTFIKSVLKEIIKKNYGFNFHASNGLHAAYLDEETAMLMKQAGFKNLRVSLETSDAVTQKETGGKVDEDKFKTAIGNLKKAGFTARDIGVYIISGLAGTDASDVRRDIEYVKSAGVMVKLANYSPIPGTSEFMKLKGDMQSMLRAEPLKQNEMYFMCINPDYTYEDNEKIKREISAYNNSL